ncbi:MAG: glutamate--tRNA ligase [Cyclobacteriaceae bacterium]
MSKVRVRFAPSPTGGLHIGGLRTALFNYLFAKKNKGDFILRIEDTDQSRFVEGAETYITNALKWCGITPDESPEIGGPHQPYRQSERKNIYREYAQQLIDEGKAYYAFDTPEEIDELREKLKASGMVNLNYNAASRMTMKNSLTLSKEEVERRINNGDSYVVRVNVPVKEDIRFQDSIRDWVVVHSSTMDDKVILKSDGLPTYHLANVVDDHLMEITHVIRGEEWLPSAPLHVLLYRYLGWEDSMPQFAHLPLILKPDGNGKLSKRAADKAGIPIFPMKWENPETKEISAGFMEAGYLPKALVNFLSLLGWNPGTEQELFSIDELIDSFSLERIGKSGTKFDIEKAKWFNQQYLKKESDESLASIVMQELSQEHNIEADSNTCLGIVELLKERVTFPHELAQNALYLFKSPLIFDQKVIRKKWNEESEKALALFADALKSEDRINSDDARELLTNKLEQEGINPGKIMQVLRLAITGAGGGPDLMGIIALMGPKKAANRIFESINTLSTLAKESK